MQENVNIPDSTITTNLSFRQLVLMNMQQLTNFPYIEKDFDALTDYELLSLVVKYLNDVIDNQNEQNDSITRMYESFLALQTYVNNTKDTLEDAFNTLDNYVRTFFENLDVQDEIDHKLDEMVEDGTLEHIIASYLQTQKIYNTHQEMIADASNLVVGLTVQTLGYYTINDGGGAFYKITDTESLIEYQEDLGNDLYATMIINDCVNVHQFGAYGDGIHDDAESVKSAITSKANKITFIKSKTYLVTPFNSEDVTDEYNIQIPSNTIVDLSNATIKTISTSRDHYKVFSFKDVENSKLINGTIIGDVDTHDGETGEWGYGVSIIHSNNIELNNLYITKCWGDGININFKEVENFTSDNIRILNCISDDNRRQGMSIEAGNNIYVENCQFINTGFTSYTAPGSGIDIEPLVNNITMKNIVFENCIFAKNHGIQFVGGGSKANNRVVKNLRINNCIIDDTDTSYEWSIWIKDITDSSVTNCKIGSSMSLVFVPSNDFTLSNNKIIGRHINVQTSSCQNSVITINNNICRTPADYKSTIGFLENYSTSPNVNKNNTFVISNNVLIDKTSGDYVYSAGLINLLYAQGIDKAIITNNYVEGSNSGISTNCSSTIKDNIIVGTEAYGMSLLGNTDATKHSYFDVQNNTFYNTGNQTSVIFNYARKDMVIRNNTYYPVYPNEGIGSTNYSKAGFVTYSSNLTGYVLIEDNNIITSTE